MESFIFTALLGFVMMVPLMFTLLGWFSTSMEAESCHNVEFVRLQFPLRHRFLMSPPQGSRH